MKGQKTGGGSRKGRPNKITADLRDAILHAFDAAGGPDYLEKIAAEHPQVFCTLLGKVLPTRVTGELSGNLTLAELVAEAVKPIAAR
ncbi:MAG: hypothetical protein ACREEL_08380 [Stellaceae bacterium]